MGSMPERRRRFWRAAAAAALLALCAACATVPLTQQAFSPGADGVVTGVPRPCTGTPPALSEKALAERLPGPELRVASWNLHKSSDAGWDADLLRFAAASDLLMIQEAALTPELQRVFGDAGFDWLLASAFTLDDHETGVLSAARVRPAGACVQRYYEPLLQLPKSALVVHYTMQGLDGTVAVANLHAINFTLALGGYRAQLDAVAQELANHRGPLIFAGDFNTWSAARQAEVEEVMRGLGLVPVLPTDDTRRRFFGRPLDHLYVRGFEVVHAEAPQVTSSDHNPLLATLRLTAAGGGYSSQSIGNVDSTSTPARLNQLVSGSVR